MANSKVKREWNNSLCNNVFDLDDLEGIKKTFPILDLYIYSKEKDGFLDDIVRKEYSGFVFAARKTDFPRNGLSIYMFPGPNDGFHNFFNGMNECERRGQWTHFGSVSCFMQAVSSKKIEKKKKTQEDEYSSLLDYDDLIRDGIKIAKKHWDSIPDFKEPDPKIRGKTIAKKDIGVQVLFINGDFYAGRY